MAKKEEAKEVIEFTQQEIDNLSQIFTLARIQLVNSKPDDKVQLANLLNFEKQLIDISNLRKAILIAHLSIFLDITTIRLKDFFN